ncbi:hypothetical protein [Pseudomonas amygdali]|nr:hypothetical protein [Pseudomonas amygdali]
MTEDKQEVKALARPAIRVRKMHGAFKSQFDDAPMKHVYRPSVRLAPSMLTKALIGFIALVCVSLVLATAW